MDSIFALEDGARATYLQHLMRTLRSTYICLWSFPPQATNCLVPMAGFYNDENVQLDAASTSTGATLGRRLFDDYRRFFFNVSDDHVPGLAFKNGIPFMELKDWQLQRLVSVEAQMQFYQEAKIKSAVFMGCKAGEIELGFSDDHPQVNLETELKNWFPEDFLQQAPPLLLDRTRPSSSESSLHSLSVDSSESPFLFTMPSTPLVIDPNKDGIQIFEPTLKPTLTPLQDTLSPLHQVIMQPYRNNPQIIPTSNETENEAMTKAILAVLSASSSPPNLSASSTPQNVGVNYPLSKDNVSAFKRFGSGSDSGSGKLLGATGGVGAKRQNMTKKSLAFFRALNLMRRSQDRLQGIRPNTTQMHHMISERKRREKLNESFDTLRSLLPPGTKKDKASVLKSTTECLTSLKAQVAELTKTLQNLETQMSHERVSQEERISLPPNERLRVHVTNLPETTSQGRIVNLQVFVRGDINNLGLLIRVLEFLKQVENVEVVSMEADTKVDESSSIHRVVLKLKIERGEWDESAFQEAVRRVAADLAQ